MSFIETCPRSFTQASIRSNAPAASGVYGLASAREWIFIGETNDIQARLLEHLEETDTELAYRKPSGFVFEMCSASDRTRRQDVLVRQLEPFCNRRIGRGSSSAHRR